MAKRFTDTDKWKREWFHDLKPNAKLAWLYLLDQCDHAGIWPRNFRLMSEQLGFKFDHALMIEWFFGKVIHFDEDKYFIPSFFEFQYGASKEGFKARLSALSRLQQLGLASESGEIKCSEHLPNTSGQSNNCPSNSIGKGIGKGIKGGVGEKSTLRSEIEAIYREVFPLKKGKEKGILKLLGDLKGPEEVPLLRKAAEAYRDDCKTSGTAKEYILHFKTWAGEWRDWAEDDVGASSVAPAAKQTSLERWMNRDQGKTG